jgi:hypothetical protein
MTRCVKRICIHCKRPYYYASSVSSYGVDTIYNDEEYCEVCKKVIIEALASIPKVAEQRFIDSVDYTVEQLLDIQAKSSESNPMVRRVCPPLFDLKNSKNNNTVMVVNAPDRQNASIMNTYLVSYWTNEDTKTITGEEVRKQVWWNLTEDKISTEH